MNIKCIFVQSLAAQCALLTWRRRYTCQRFKVRFLSCLLFPFFFPFTFLEKVRRRSIYKRKFRLLKNQKKKKKILRKHFEFRYNNNIIDSIVYRLPSTVYSLTFIVYHLISIVCVLVNADGSKFSVAKNKLHREFQKTSVVKIIKRVTCEKPECLST